MTEDTHSVSLLDAIIDEAPLSCVKISKTPL